MENCLLDECYFLAGREVIYIKIDPFSELSLPLTREELSGNKIALIVIDMQYNITAEGQGVLKYAEELGVRDGYQYYYDRIQNIIIPNIQELLKVFRKTEKMIVFTRIMANYFTTEDNSYKDLNEEKGVILEEIKPLEDELVITKRDPDIFQGTGLDSHLRENGIDTLILVGVLTNECVEASVIRAVEEEYSVILIEDSTAAFSEEIHKKALDLIQKKSVLITSTQDILRLL